MSGMEEEGYYVNRLNISAEGLHFRETTDFFFILKLHFLNKYFLYWLLEVNSGEAIIN